MIALAAKPISPPGRVAHKCGGKRTQQALGHSGNHIKLNKNKGDVCRFARKPANGAAHSADLAGLLVLAPDLRASWLTSAGWRANSVDVPEEKVCCFKRLDALTRASIRARAPGNIRRAPGALCRARARDEP